jgi:hypothetical protein
MKIRIAAAVALLVIAAVTGCSGVLYGHSQATGSAAAEPGVSTYLCSGSTSDELLQWRSSGGYLSGTYQYADLSGQAPQEQVSSNSGNLSGTLDGTAITVSIGLSQDLYGTLSGGQLTLNVPQQDGTIQAATCNQATVNDWNSAVASLNSQAGSDNKAQASASAAAATQQQIAALQSGLQSDVTTLAQDAARLDGDNSLAGDVQAMKNDLGTEQKDYATVQNDTCSSAGGSRETDASTVDTDASTVDTDQSTVQTDISSLQNNQVSSDISKVQGDVSQLKSLGASPDTDPSAALAAGNKALKDMASAIAWAQQQASALDGQAHQIAKAADALASRC